MGSAESPEDWNGTVGMGQSVQQAEALGSSGCAGASLVRATEKEASFRVLSVGTCQWAEKQGLGWRGVGTACMCHSHCPRKVPQRGLVLVPPGSWGAEAW